jgi:hypothetical protein
LSTPTSSSPVLLVKACVISSTVISLLPILYSVSRLIILHICKFAFHLF